MKNTISFFFAYAIIISCVSFSQIDTEHRFPFIEREILNSPAKQNNLMLFKNPDHVTNNSNSDSIITAVISHINKDSVQYFIQSLQDLGTRYMLAPNRDSVARRIKSEFHRIGFTDVKLDSFQYEGTWQQNVVATLPGRLNTDYNVLIGGHYDSYSSGDPTVFAPGVNLTGFSAIYTSVLTPDKPGEVVFDFNSSVIVKLKVDGEEVASFTNSHGNRKVSTKLFP